MASTPLQLTQRLSSTYVNTLVELEAVNYTPLWIGGYDGRTVTASGIAKVTGETLKGVMRYAARLAFAAALARSGAAPRSFKDVECWVAKLLGGVVKGGRNGELEFRTASLLSLNVYVESAGRPIVDRSGVYSAVHKALNQASNLRVKFTELLVAAGYLLQLHAAGQDIKAIPNLVKGKKQVAVVRGGLQLARRCIQDNASQDECTFYLLASIPRFSLLLLGVKSGNPKHIANDIYGLLPLEPGSVKLRVSVSLPPHYYLLGANLPVNDLARLAGASLIFALAVHGVGKATSRGFGRFKITSVRGIPKAAEELQEIARDLQDPNTHGQALERLLKVMEDAASRLLHPLSNLGGVACNVSGGGALGVPAASHVMIRVVRNARHPGPYPVQWSTVQGLTQLTMNRPQLLTMARNLRRVKHAEVLLALSAIGHAAMKYIWKIAYGVNTRTPGGAFHTWLLGLPRNQQGTGYAFASMNNKCSRRGGPNRNGGRRKSPVIAYPLPPTQNDVSVAVVTFATYSDHYNKLMHDEVLVHVGKHGKGSTLWLWVAVRCIIDDLCPRGGRGLPYCSNLSPQNTCCVAVPSTQGCRYLHVQLGSPNSIQQLLQAAHEWVVHLLS